MNYRIVEYKSGLFGVQRRLFGFFWQEAFWQRFSNVKDAEQLMSLFCCGEEGRFSVPKSKQKTKSYLQMHILGLERKRLFIGSRVNIFDDHRGKVIDLWWIDRQLERVYKVYEKFLSRYATREH